ncbi:hypothetical protein Mapa_010724 [Marchantia paleacea]|nr:hypothetical protein Mapa_010724 [Marchantia paleacea]
MWRTQSLTSNGSRSVPRGRGRTAFRQKEDGRFRCINERGWPQSFDWQVWVPAVSAQRLAECVPSALVESTLSWKALWWEERRARVEQSLTLPDTATRRGVVKLGLRTARSDNCVCFVIPGVEVESFAGFLLDNERARLRK